MNVTIQSIHFDADRKLTSFITQKVSKLDQYFDSIVDAQVFLKLDRNPSAGNKIFEIKLLVPNETLLCSERGRTFEEATDLCLDTAKRQLTKYKEKLRATA